MTINICIYYVYKKIKQKHDIKIYFYNFFSNKQKDFEEEYLVITTAQFIEWCYCETNYSEYLHVNKWKNINEYCQLICIYEKLHRYVHSVFSKTKLSVGYFVFKTNKFFLWNKEMKIQNLKTNIYKIVNLPELFVELFEVLRPKLNPSLPRSISSEFCIWAQFLTRG